MVTATDNPYSTFTCFLGSFFLALLTLIPVFDSADISGLSEFNEITETLPAANICALGATEAVAVLS